MALQPFSKRLNDTAILHAVMDACTSNPALWWGLSPRLGEPHVLTLHLCCGHHHQEHHWGASGWVGASSAAWVFTSRQIHVNIPQV